MVKKLGLGAALVVCLLNLCCLDSKPKKAARIKPAAPARKKAARKTPAPQKHTISEAERARRIKNRVLASSPMVHIPAGKFLQGCDNKRKDNNCAGDETPQRLVRLSSYYMDIYEVSVMQFKACVEAGACSAKGASLGSMNGDDQPVHAITWYEASKYCAWLGKRLPTEAQWERAARGDRGAINAWGKELGCKYSNSSMGETPLLRGQVYRVCENGPTPVTWFKRDESPWGLYQMGGNVSEWVSDWYTPDYYRKGGSNVSLR